MRPSTPVLLFLAVALGGCRTPLHEIVPLTECSGSAPTCVAAGDACGRWQQVDAVCDPSTRRFTCPAGSRLHARAAGPARQVCRPFRRVPGLSSIAGWGLGHLCRLPIEDGRCLWVADSVAFADGSVRRNVAFEADPLAPFGTCPEESLIPPRSIVTVKGEGPPDPDLFVQLGVAFRLAGQTLVPYRLFRADAKAVFGVTLVRGGMARWDPQTQRIIVPPVDLPAPWGLSLQLGDASYVPPGSDSAFVWGCAEPAPGRSLVQSCRLARVDAAGRIELLTRIGDPASFVPGVRAADAVTVFASGAWSASVRPVGGEILHFYIAGFGDTLESHVADSPLGPFRDGPTGARCDTAPGDEKPMCAGPVLHDDLIDPTRPGELVIGYGVGTTGPARADVDGYWPRVVWID